MYALIVDGQVKQYPYGADVLRRDNPQISFPINPADSLLAEWGVLPVAATNIPGITYRQNLAEGKPTLRNGVWTQVWVVTDASDVEVNQRTQAQAEAVRTERDRLLAESDWTQLKDVSEDVAQVWATYRQALRDLSQQAGFPWAVQWPTKP